MTYVGRDATQVLAGGIIRIGRALSGYPDVLGATGDEVAVTDPDSQFYGWTTNQINAYWASQNVAVLTPSLAAKGVFHPGDDTPTYAESDVRAAIAEAAAFAKSDPVVSAALAKLGTDGSGIVTAHGEELEANAAADRAMKNTAALLDDARAALRSRQASGALFTDTLDPTKSYTDDELRGMISTDQWLADFISVAKGGQPTNAQAAANKVPSGVTPPAVVTLYEATGPTLVGTRRMALPVPGGDSSSGSDGSSSSSDAAAPTRSLLPIAAAGAVAFFLLSRH